MTRVEFLNELNLRLADAGVPDAQDLLFFYDEAIRDRMDSGMPEEVAVADVGSIQEIVRNARAEMPMPLVVREAFTNYHEEAKSRGTGWLWILLVILFFPAILGALSALLGLYIGFWGMVIGLFAAVCSIGIAGVCLTGYGAIICIFHLFPMTSGVLILGAGLFLIGLSLLLWLPTKALTKLLIFAVKTIFIKIKRALLR